VSDQTLQFIHKQVGLRLDHLVDDALVDHAEARKFLNAVGDVVGIAEKGELLLGDMARACLLDGDHLDQILGLLALLLLKLLLFLGLLFFFNLDRVEEFWVEGGEDTENEVAHTLIRFDASFENDFEDI
jgi:hypothetical protein